MARAPAKRTRRARTGRRQADGETEQRILDAARRVFVRRGTAGARMQEIAAEAGVNQALLHYYFRSKERLSGAVFAQLATRMFPTFAQILGGERPLAEKIEAVIATYLDLLTAHPFLPGYLIAELHHHPQRVRDLLSLAAGGSPEAMLAPVREVLARQIRAEARAGRMRAIAPEQLIVNLVSLCIFPFAARPMLGILLGLDDAAFARFIEERRATLPAFVQAGLRA